MGMSHLPWRTRAVASGAVTLHVREAGDPSDPTVVLVHGYPDCSAVWDDVAAELVLHHHVVTYDGRGMGASSRPDGPGGYRLPLLANDLFRVLDAVSPDRPAHVVGHDWGSIQSWEAVTDAARNHRIASYTSISGPCLDHVGHAVRAGLRLRSGRLPRTLRQGLRSTYIVVLHAPVLPEVFWRTVGARAWRRFQRVVEGVGDDGRHPTLAADGGHGVELYRQNVVHRLARPRRRVTDVPVLLLTLAGDRYVTPTLSEDLEQWAPDLTRRSLDAGHWAPRTHPGAVAAAIGAHVAAVEAAAVRITA
jgi:pimeloyl-ACP methyl ester carboxylesterase